MRKIFFTFLFALCLSSSTLLAQTPSGTPQEPPAKWTVDDVINQEQASNFAISPDCKWVVWVKRTADADKGVHVANVMLSSLTEKKEIELTRGSDGSTNPKWSPDGQFIAFVSTKPLPKKSGTAEDGPKPQVWLISPFGGEPWPVTESSRGISTFDWIDSNTILFASQEDTTLFENTIKEKKDTSNVVDDELHAPPVRLFKLDVKARKVTRFSDNTDRIFSVNVSPDGKYAVTIHDRSLRFTYNNRVKPVAFLYDLKTGERKQIFTEPKFNLSQIRWTRDGSAFYAASAFTSHPLYVQATITELYHYLIGNGEIHKVDLPENGLAGDFEVTEDGFIALLANGARNKIARFRHLNSEKNSWKQEPLTGDHVQNIFGFEFGKDNQTLVYNSSTASTPTQWYRSQLNNTRIESPTQFTELNPYFKKRIIAKTEVIRWKGARDEEVEGILYYPHNYEAGKKYPLVVQIHGGPAGADQDEWEERWAYPTNLMAQRGAFVFKPNYHGSSNYGLKWVESITNGNYYDLEVPDIEKGVDSLIARSLIDPGKMGIAGWSNGSILTIAVTVTTTRYKVASAGAGDVDWASDWGNCEFGYAFDNLYFGKSPLEDPQLYLKKSPFYRLDRVRTPTIIFFGTEDTQVPTQQGWMHYRALSELGKTDVRFILFPGERHGPQKHVHQRRKITEELAWFDKYLFATAKEENEAFKADSPLATALKLKSAKRDNGRVGLVEHGVLIPETVKLGNLELGRFEVTRAQFATFDKSYQVEAGKENFPANAITFEQAKAYCDWLSQTTGQTYRLANESEMETLPALTGATENTLDYWAGYTVNPDDTNRLQQKIKELGGFASLLKEVGSFKGAGTEDFVFDLGGNVAEWIIGKDGHGKVYGGSADLPTDTRIQPRKPAPECTGFRIVKGASNQTKTQ